MLISCEKMSAIATLQHEGSTSATFWSNVAPQLRIRNSHIFFRNLQLQVHNFRVTLLQVFQIDSSQVQFYYVNISVIEAQRITNNKRSTCLGFCHSNYSKREKNSKQMICRFPRPWNERCRSAEAWLWSYATAYPQLFAGSTVANDSYLRNIADVRKCRLQLHICPPLLFAKICSTSLLSCQL